MDLVTIAAKLWRHRRLTIPVMVLTLIAAGYIVTVRKPVYQAEASFALLNPPAPPSADEIARDPELAKINADNPYTRFGDQTVIVQVLVNSLLGPTTKRSLVAAGVDPRFTVEPSVELGYASPLMRVTAVGASRGAAMASAKLLATTLTKTLDTLQSVEGVDTPYRIKALPVERPDDARLQASGTLRALVGVLVMGTVILFIVVSVADAVTTLTATRRQQPPEPSAAQQADVPWHPDEPPLGERPLASVNAGNGTRRSVRKRSAAKHRDDAVGSEPTEVADVTRVAQRSASSDFGAPPTRSHTIRASGK